MPAFPSVFPLWWIALTAAIAFGASIALLFVLSRRGYAFTAREIFLLAFVVGLSVLAWRSAANVPLLNDDPIPPFSPNDFLCPLVTFVALELYAAFRKPGSLSNWERTRAWLTLVAFVVNVFAI